MLQLCNIKKDYKVGDSTVAALKGVSLAFRRNEFVSILGASGCGKTTLLNIIGGLDHYTSGDLIIEGISTKNYNDGDWDTYRNHRIGFVFQTYNLIPHQTVLGNVELALTLSGVSPKERKERATEALRRVGLGSELNKRPNQLSGGQMQRVAIARALVNNPEILLADEPTGALDTKTSVQIMDLIKEIAGERLVIMVTHNPELAYKYSSRIVELKDGLVVSDSAPYSPEEEKKEAEEHRAAQEREAAERAQEREASSSAAGGKKGAPVYKKKHSSMSLLTAFALSGKNLLTKKGRTLVTAIAGSIGIISVCLVLALSSGFNNYIAKTEEDMLSYYPVNVTETSLDLTSAMTSFMDGSIHADLPTGDEIADKVIVNSFLSNLAQGMTTYNDLTEGNVANVNGQDVNYLQFLEAMPEELYNAITYSYGVSISANLFTDVYIGSSSSEMATQYVNMSLESLRNYYTALLTYKSEEYSSLTQFIPFFTDVVSVMPGTSDLSDEAYGSYVLSQYDVLAGHFPQSTDEVVLVVGSSNDVIDLTLVQLGFFTESEFLNLFISADEGSDIVVDPDDVKTEIPFDEVVGKEYTLFYNDEVFVENPTGVGYKYIYSGSQPIGEEGLGEITSEQGRTLKISGVLRLKDGLTYGCLSSGLCLTEQLIQEYIAQNMQSAVVRTLNEATDASIINTIVGQASIQTGGEGGITMGYSPRFSSTSTSLEEVIRELGGNDRPSALSIYAKDFDSKSGLLDYLDEWNSAVSAARQDYEANGANSVYADENGEYIGPTEINYSDTVGTLMGMMNTILNAITYVLIAFTAISLVVSTVMIGVITYVSVVERTKEIGILRSIGARKRDIRHVFNAETFIIGLCAGLIGVLVAYLLQLLINVILTPLTGISGLAALPVYQAVIMVVISVVLTLISGLIPASAAAKKDPVIALRTE